MKEQWLLDDLVFTTGNKAYGISKTGATICLGDVDKVVEAINTGNGTGFDSYVSDTILHIIELRNELRIKELNEHGRQFTGNQTRRRTPKPERQGNKRTRLMHPVRYQYKHTRPIKKSGKITSNLLKQNEPML